MCHLPTYLCVYRSSMYLLFLYKLSVICISIFVYHLYPTSFSPLTHQSTYLSSIHASTLSSFLLSHWLVLSASSHFRLAGLKSLVFLERWIMNQCFPPVLCQSFSWVDCSVSFIQLKILVLPRKIRHPFIMVPKGFQKFQERWTLLLTVRASSSEGPRGLLVWSSRGHL